MATAKKRTTQKQQAEEEPVAKADALDAEPLLIENEPAEAPETVEAPVATLASTPQTAAGTDYARPLRVETFARDGKWGYRLCDARGAVLRESPVDFDTRDGAAEGADEEDFGEPVVRATRNGPGRGRGRGPRR
jgi:hypothetical protein